MYARASGSRQNRGWFASVQMTTSFTFGAARSNPTRYAQYCTRCRRVRGGTEGRPAPTSTTTRVSVEAAATFASSPASENDGRVRPGRHGNVTRTAPSPMSCTGARNSADACHFRPSSSTPTSRPGPARATGARVHASTTMRASRRKEPAISTALSKNQAAVGDRAAHADPVVDADRRRVLGPHEEADGRRAREQEAAEVPQAPLRVALVSGRRIDPDLLELHRTRRPRRPPRGARR